MRVWRLGAKFRSGPGRGGYLQPNESKLHLGLVYYPVMVLMTP